MKKRFFPILVATLMVFAMMLVMSQTSYADSPVTYIDQNGVVQSCTEYTTISTDDVYDWSGGWYFATGVNINERITVNGVVNVILCDKTILNANKGIAVEEGSTLNIYAQSMGSDAGILVAKVEGSEFEDISAGIGSAHNGKNAGTVTINGGNITASGYNGGAGIGGYIGTAGGTVTVNGGSVTATGGNLGAGIGGGESGAGGTVTINGGSVSALGGENAAGIGGGGAYGRNGGAGGDVTINGGSVTATGKDGAAGIGGGGPYRDYTGGAGGDVTINGGSVTATCGDSGRAGIGSGKGSSTPGIVELGTGVNVEAGDSEDDYTSIKASTFEEAHNYYKWAHTYVSTGPTKIDVPTGKTMTYNGKAQTGVAAGTGYTLSGTTSATNAGSYQATATLDEGYAWGDGSIDPKTISWKINKAANPLTVKAKTATVKYKKLKKKAQTIKRAKAITVSKAQGKQSYKLVSAKKGKKSFKKKFKINAKTGNVTVKKGLKKGTYKVKIKVKAAGNTNYKASVWKTVTFKVKVK